MAGLLDFLKTPEGQGLLSGVAGYAATARRGTPVNNLGRGLMGGISGYTSAQEQAKAIADEKNKKDLLAQLFAPQQTTQTQYKVDGKTFGSMPEAVQHQQAFDPAQEIGMALNNEFGGAVHPSNTDFSAYAQPPYTGPDMAPKTNIEAVQTQTQQPPMDQRAQIQALIQGGLISPAEGFKLLASGGGDDTAQIKNWQFAQGLPEDQRTQFMGGLSSGNVPSAIQEWQAYQGMSPEAKTEYLRMKRADQVLNLGGQMAVRSPTGGISETYIVQPKITDTPDYQAAQETAKVSATEKAQRGAEATSNLPKVQANADNVRSMVQGVLDHPGFSSTVGVTVMPGARFVPGTKEADFMSRMDQLKGSAFLQAFETLKGGGHITEVEGKKATDAINRMSISTSENEFRAAAQDFLSVVDRAELNALRAAGAQTEQVTPDQAKLIQQRRAAGVSDADISKELNMNQKKQASGTFKDPYTVTNDADYNSVPKGKYYQAPDGSIRIRK